MARTKKLSGSVKKAYDLFKAQEGAQDKLVLGAREIVRGCAMAIKYVHAADLDAAGEEMKKVEKLVSGARKAENGMGHVVAQAYQEYCEARVLLAVLADEEIPGVDELGIPIESYLTGLMDSVGEFRREMLEQLKKGRKKAAEKYFDAMTAVYEETLPLKFSNSILPGFRRKQDVARGQLENARSELLRFSR